MKSIKKSETFEINFALSKTWWIVHTFCLKILRDLIAQFVVVQCTLYVRLLLDFTCVFYLLYFHSFTSLETFEKAKLDKFLYRKFFNGYPFAYAKLTSCGLSHFYIPNPPKLVYLECLFIAESLSWGDSMYLGWMWNPPAWQVESLMSAIISSSRWKRRIQLDLCKGKCTNAAENKKKLIFEW